MGKYQLGKKDAKLNGRFHSQLRRENQFQKNEKVQRLKAAQHATGAEATGGAGEAVVKDKTAE